MRPSQEFLGTGEHEHLFQVTVKQRPKNKGNREHRQFSGTGNIENQDFVFGEQGHFFEGNKGTGTLPGRASIITCIDSLTTPNSTSY